jgi:predicted ATP-dependent Lon-type protease
VSYPAGPSASRTTDLAANLVALEAEASVAEQLGILSVILRGVLDDLADIAATLDLATNTLAAKFTTATTSTRDWDPSQL